jgi:hypothetical protein
LLAVTFMIWLVNDIRTVMWAAVVPTLIAVALLMIYVREPEHEQVHGHVKAPLTFVDIKRLTLRYWTVVVLGAVFTRVRFSEALLVLRADDVGLALGYVPVVMVVMNVFYAAADRFREHTLQLSTSMYCHQAGLAYCLMKCI